MVAALLDWLDSRTGYRALRAHALDEPLPPGTGWTFTTGSVVALLAGLQFVTGFGLAMYYVPSPALAYDSMRFLIDQVPLGWLLRGLHVWGASFMVVAAAVHMTRAFWSAAYKAPREVTWITGVTLLLLILAFSLTGYLLPWDQKAYWATTVTISVAESSPLVGERLADVLRGGHQLGALTLGRWYAAHVFLLPAALVAFVTAHIALMRRHGISGPLDPARRTAGDVLSLARDQGHADDGRGVRGAAHRRGAAAGAPRRDRQPRRRQLRAAAGVVLPAAVPAAQVRARPARDRRHADRAGPGRSRRCSRCRSSTAAAPGHPWAPARRRFTAAFAVAGLAVATLTWLGLRDAPPRFDPNRWGPQALAGYLLIDGPGRHVRALPRRGRTGRAGARDADQPRRRLAAVPHGRPGGHRAGRAAGVAGVRAGARRGPGAGGAGQPAAAARRRLAAADPRRQRRADRDPGHPLRRLPHAGRRRRHHRSGSQPRRRPAGRGGHPPHHHRPERRVRRLDDADLRQPARRET